MHCFQSDPTTRSPLEYPCGLFIADTPAFGGARGFCWFASEAAGLDYLRWRLVGLYTCRLGLMHDEAETACRLDVQRALAGVITLGQVELDAVNAALSDFCEVRWAGSLDELRLGHRPFEREVQQDFRENVFGDERGFGQSDLCDWAQHTTHYSS